MARLVEISHFCQYEVKCNRPSIYTVIDKYGQRAGDFCREHAELKVESLERDGEIQYFYE